MAFAPPPNGVAPPASEYLSKFVSPTRDQPITMEVGRRGEMAGEGTSGKKMLSEVEKGAMRRIFVDTAKVSWSGDEKQRNERKKRHTCYDPSTDKFFEVADLRELPRCYTEVYLDSFGFPNMWPQLRQLLEEGRKVFYFTRLWKLPKLREQFVDEMEIKTGKRTKSDRGDAFLLSKSFELSLMRINSHRYFREITIIDVELRPLIQLEHMIFKNIQRLIQHMEFGAKLAETMITEYKKMLENVRAEIVRKAANLLPEFLDVARILGLDLNDINGLTGLAGLLTYLKFPSIKKCVNYLGLYKAKGRGGKVKKKCNRKVTRYLNMLAASLMRKNGIISSWPKLRDLRMVLKQVIIARKQLIKQGSPWLEGG